MSEDQQLKGDDGVGKQPDPIDRASPTSGIWKPVDAPEGLIEQAAQTPPHAVELGADRIVVIHDALGGDGLRRLERTLRSLSTVPEISELEAIYVVDEIGRFLGPDGTTDRPVLALPIAGGAKLVLCRKILDDDDTVEELFERFIRREKLARAGEQERGDGGAGSDLEGPGLEGPRRYQGRTIIDRGGGQITGGVYLSGDGDQPAIVVDHTKDHRLRRLYRELVASITAEHRSGVWRTLSGRLRSRSDGEESEEHRLLRYVHAAVREHLPPWQPEAHDGRTVDEEVMSAIAERGEPVRPGQKIYLGEYLRISTAEGVGGGEAVHRSLLAAHLLERLLEDGLLEGSVSFEHARARDSASYAWVRFVGRNGMPWVVDASEQYVGPLEEAPQPVYLEMEDIRVLRSQPL